MQESLDQIQSNIEIVLKNETLTMSARALLEESIELIVSLEESVGNAEQDSIPL